MIIEKDKLKEKISQLIKDRTKNDKILNSNVVDSSIVCSFTGHRPKSLPISNNISFSSTLKEITSKLKNLIIETIKNGHTYFICGLAQGIDLLSAELVIELKHSFPFISLECAIPCENQYSDYCIEDLKRYYDILKNSDFVTLVSKNYSAGCMMKRNRYMVNKSSLIIGVWNGNKGGTYNTLNYAKKKGIVCKLIYF